MTRFRRYVGIDYSGAGGPEERIKGIQVYTATGSGRPTREPREDGRWWSRRGLAEWLGETLRGREPTIVGIDHAFSFPRAYLDKYRDECRCGSWREFLEDFHKHWPTDRRKVKDLRPRNRRTGDKRWFRTTDTWSSSAKSVFDIDGPGVAKSTHAGLPWLLRMRQELDGSVHFWPFDGFEVPVDKSVIAEVYPSLFRRRYPEEIKSEFGGKGEQRKRRDEVDAYCVARWLQDRDERNFLGDYLDVKSHLTEKECNDAMLEGWILGVA